MKQKIVIRKLARSRSEKPVVSEPESPVLEPTSRNEPNESGENRENERRVSFITDRNVTEIDWNRFKSERGREAIRNLIRLEALKIGFVEAKKADESTDELFTCDAVLSLYNTAVISSVLAMTHCPQKVAEILAFDEKEREMINMNGAGDRLVAKYIGALDFKYRDELMVGIALGPLMITKLTMFRRVMDEWKRRKAVTSVTSFEEGQHDPRFSRSAASGKDNAQ